MFKKLVVAVAVFITTMGLAFAQVDANKADQAALDGIKGIGPKLSKTIIEERKKGEFKDWTDFEKRVKGVGDKSAAKLSQAGLTIAGKSRPGSPPASAKTVRKDTAKTAPQTAKSVEEAKSGKK